MAKLVLLELCPRQRRRGTACWRIKSFLNVRGEAAVLDTCRRCFASLFTDRAISYREAKGFDYLKVGPCGAAHLNKQNQTRLRHYVFGSALLSRQAQIELRCFSQ
jgi:pyruvate phosphate dikinase-like enzyme